MSSQPNIIEHISFLNDKYVYPAFITIFMKVCRIYNTISDYSIYLYKSNENIRTIVDEVCYLSTSTYSFMINRKTEPRDPVWFCYSWLTLNEHRLTKYYNYNEEYSQFFTKYFCNDLFEFYPDCDAMYAMRYLESINSYIAKKPDAMLPLLVIKAISPENHTFFSVCRAKSPLAPFIYKKSSAKFISIEYTHPEMTDAIELKLDDGYYIYGNELFTPAFVLRLLEHQSISYFFDNRYKIRILDSDCSMIDFGVENHLLLSEEGYRMMIDEDNQLREVDVDDESSGSSDAVSDEEPLIIDPSNNIGSLYTPFEFGYKR